MKDAIGYSVVLPSSLLHVCVDLFQAAPNVPHPKVGCESGNKIKTGFLRTYPLQEYVGRRIYREKPTLCADLPMATDEFRGVIGAPGR
jgi:hypothetical protein